MKRKHQESGYTLVELMIAVGIVGIVSAIAIPSYQNFIETSTLGAVSSNAEILAGFEDAYFYDNDTYFAGTYQPGVDVTTLPDNLGWKPSGDKDLYIYKVEAGSTGDIVTSYKLTVSYARDTTINTVIEKP